MHASSLDKLAVLTEPIRRRLYEFVVAAPDAVDRDAAATAVRIGRPLAAFHLDRLVRAGLLAVEFRRRSGRTGPGAGRPAKFYRPIGDAELSVTIPPRAYRLAAEILAEGVSRAGANDPRVEVLAAAGERGSALGQQAASGGHPQLLELLTTQGYEPVTMPDGVVRLRNCPFHALVQRHRDLTCSMNLTLLESVVAAAGSGTVRAVADPAEGYCCVALVPGDATARRDEPVVKPNG